MVRSELLERNAALKEAFLDLERPIPNEYKIESRNGRVPFGYIYCIENKKNGKKYIGSTYSLYGDVVEPGNFAQLKKRVNQYIYEYNQGLEMVPSMVATLRPIVRAMVEEGIENFTMYPVSETGYKNHNDLEKFFINKFRTFPYGYNTNKGGKARMIYQPSQTAAGKKARSQEVIAINLNEKKIMFSDSMKLFADYMGSTKDMIKNCVRSGSQYKGWFIFYTNWQERDNVISKIINNEGVCKSRNISDKRKEFLKDFHQNISIYLSKADSEMFSDFEILNALRYED